MKMEERMRHVYRMAKANAFCKRDVGGCPCMRSQDEKLKTRREVEDAIGRQAKIVEGVL